MRIHTVMTRAAKIFSPRFPIHRMDTAAIAFCVRSNRLAKPSNRGVVKIQTWDCHATRCRVVMKIVILALALLFSVRIAHAEALTPLNTNVMLRGYCFAGSRPDKQALGGYGSADNLPKKLVNTRLGRANAISLLIVTNEVVPFGNAYRGYRLLLINRTRSEATFDASDSRLPIVQEALDENGKWRPVEYLPSSWCGNSYHRVFLPAGNYWQFVVPQYVG